MIFVTLGTQDKNFDRLVSAIDKEIKNGHIKEKVVVQSGATNFESGDMEIVDYLSQEEFENYMKKCDLLITHGGVGSILTGLSHGKKVIAAARLAKYKEHINDHQVQIVKEFAKNGYILELEDFSKLNEVIKKSKKFKPNKYKSNTKNMIKMIEDYIDNI